MQQPEPHIHIVSFNVPFPANYGGVIDVFCRVWALHSIGVHVHLHCFTYGRQQQAVLNDYCDEVLYYKRKMHWWLMFGKRPFIVASRSNKKLYDRLLQDDYPILLEGLHCCDILERFSKIPNKQGQNRRVIMVRMHNIEHEYYGLLSKSERNPLRKVYLKVEAAKLYKYQSVLIHSTVVLPISENDCDYLEKQHLAPCRLLPSFHCFDSVQSLPSGPSDGGLYALYHANLSVPENEQAAIWLINNVFAGQPWRLVVAGMSPSSHLSSLIDTCPNIDLIASPTEQKMQTLIRDAQICIMVTFQPTGLKLKLLHSLFCGRFCIVNSAIVAGSGLDEACIVADTPESMQDSIARSMVSDFTARDIEKRMHIIGKQYDNILNAHRLMTIVADLEGRG